MSETIVHPGPIFDLMIDRGKATTRWRRCQLIGARKWLNCPGLAVNSYLLDDGRPRWSDCARRARPFQFSLPLFRGSGQGCPLLRASNEHSFIVRVLRARRAPGRALLILQRARAPGAVRPCGRHSPNINVPSKLARFPLPPGETQVPRGAWPG